MKEHLFVFLLGLVFGACVMGLALFQKEDGPCQTRRRIENINLMCRLKGANLSQKELRYITGNNKDLRKLMEAE